MLGDRLDRDNDLFSLAAITFFGQTLSAHVDTDKNLRDRRAALGGLADFCVPAPWLDERLQSMLKAPQGDIAADHERRSDQIEGNRGFVRICDGIKFQYNYRVRYMGRGGDFGVDARDLHCRYCDRS